ncbi:beta strand repeat-containing protein, partial [Pseudoxanthobacter soli]|uniref:beta strand repeat-containing protein n=1 Tax=Pseudoxanthobacter soli TaxID=433840 RepID=UPI001AED06B8
MPISAATGGAGGAGGLGWTPQSGTAIGGGGGGGGGFGAIITGSGNLGTLSVNATGGVGGAGGTGGYAGGGGYSGAGGAGLYIVNSGNFTSFIVSSTVSGGAGGGASGTSYGGAGGTGLFIYNSDGNKITVVDGAVIQGGKGGSVTDGTGWYSNLGPGTPGVGAAGIIDYWGNTEIVLASGATVSGGLNGDLLDQNGNVTTAGVTRANAINFLGSGSNVLELQGNGASSGQSYATIVGNVVGSTAVGSSNTLKLSGSGGVFDLSQIDVGSGGSTSVLYQNFGHFVVNSTGTWIATGAPYAPGGGAIGQWSVDGGVLQVGNASTSGSVPGAVTVASGATLTNISTGASGAEVVDDITVQSGGHLAAYAVANTPAVATLFGSLILNAGASLDVTLDAPSNFPLIGVGVASTPNVVGNLSLNGTLNVTDSGGMVAGSYLLINYAGTLSGSGLTIGAAPSDFEYSIDTVSTSNAVYLVITDAGLYWNGTTTSGSGPVAGGDGTWTASQSQLNWTNSTGTTHVASDITKAAIFAGTAGTVTIDTSNGTVGAKNLKFLTSGYVIGGGVLTLANGSATPAVNVDGAGTTATISSSIAGSDGIEKTGAGTLVLSGANTYTGGTTVTDGTLQISGSGTLGSGSYSGAVSLASGTALDYASSAAQTLSGAISGSGALTKSGTGTLTLSGANTYSGATTINAGTLVASGGSAIGNASAVTVAGGASLTVNAGETIGSLAGAGSVSLTSLAQLNLGGDNTSTTFSGVISGSGGLDKAGSGTLTLSGANTLTGVVQVLAGGL